MLLIRVALAFLALSDIACRGLRPTCVRPSWARRRGCPRWRRCRRTYPPSIASDGNTTYVAYMEERAGIMFHRISATGTEIGAPQQLQSPGTASTEYPKIAVSGENVYVAWIQGSFFTPQMHAVVATSHDGGRTFSQAVMAGHAPTGGGACDLALGADGDNVFVAFVDNQSRCGRRAAATAAAASRAWRSSPRRVTSPTAAATTRSTVDGDARVLGVADRRVRHRHAPLDRRRAHDRAGGQADRQPRPPGLSGRARRSRPTRAARRDRLQHASTSSRARTRPAPTGASSRRCWSRTTAARASATCTSASEATAASATTAPRRTGSTSTAMTST